ncbi:hypothetical protein XENTR_v10014148 [Xenopus tropicalis]|nr:hypothetical protein XENTR_v10014148 [Xenopus tropicalis]
MGRLKGAIETTEGIRPICGWKANEEKVYQAHHPNAIQNYLHTENAVSLVQGTLAGTALRSIQKDTQESITIRVAGCRRKKKMWRHNVKLMHILD